MGAQIRSVVDLTPLCCSPKEAAKLTNLSVDVIYHAITAQELPAFEMVVAGKRVNRRLIMIEDLKQWLQDYKVGYCSEDIGDKVFAVEPRDRTHPPVRKKVLRRIKREENREKLLAKQALDHKEFMEKIGAARNK